MSEKRVYMRTGFLPVNARIKKDNEQYDEVEVKDISSGGMSIILTEPLNEGHAVTVELSIRTATVNYELGAAAKIIYNKRMLLRGRYNCGLMFTDITDEKRKELNEIVTRAGMSSFL